MGLCFQIARGLEQGRALLARAWVLLDTTLEGELAPLWLAVGRLVCPGPLFYEWHSLFPEVLLSSFGLLGYY